MKQLIQNTLKANGIVAKVKPEQGNWRVDVRDDKDVLKVHNLFPNIKVCYGFYK